MGIAYIQVITSSHSPEHVSSLFVTCSVKAGIANIMGRTGYDMATHWVGTQANPSGPFYRENTLMNCMHPVSYQREYSLSFDASRVSSIYGSSNTVTPLSLANIFLIRY